jgi:hypothetical protein
MSNRGSVESNHGSVRSNRGSVRSNHESVESVESVDPEIEGLNPEEIQLLYTINASINQTSALLSRQLVQHPEVINYAYTHAVIVALKEKVPREETRDQIFDSFSMLLDPILNKTTSQLNKTIFDLVLELFRKQPDNIFLRGILSMILDKGGKTYKSLHLPPRPPRRGGRRTYRRRTIKKNRSRSRWGKK